MVSECNEKTSKGFKSDKGHDLICFKRVRLAAGLDYKRKQYHRPHDSYSCPARDGNSRHNNHLPDQRVQVSLFIISSQEKQI